MPSHVHEVLTEMVRHRPELVGELLSGPLKLSLPAWERVRVDSSDLTEIKPTEYRADARGGVHRGGPAGAGGGQRGAAQPRQREALERRSTVWRRWSSGARSTKGGRGGGSGDHPGRRRGPTDVLAARGIEVSDEIRYLITSCTDLVQLDTWLRRAATANSLADVLD